MGNTFGQLFRVTTFGESHGGGIGLVVFIGELISVHSRV
jgi:chorismate synthase